jgi:hypothetical protein
MTTAATGKAVRSADEVRISRKRHPDLEERNKGTGRSNRTEENNGRPNLSGRSTGEQVGLEGGGGGGIRVRPSTASSDARLHQQTFGNSRKTTNAPAATDEGTRPGCLGRWQQADERIEERRVWGEGAASEDEKRGGSEECGRERT